MDKLGSPLKLFKEFNKNTTCKDISHPSRCARIKAFCTNLRMQQVHSNKCIQ